MVTFQLVNGIISILFGIHMIYTVKQLIQMIEQGITVTPEDNQLLILKKKVFLFFFGFFF